MGDKQGFMGVISKIAGQLPAAVLAVGAFWMGGTMATGIAKEQTQFNERITLAIERLSNVMTDLHADVNRSFDYKG